MDKAPSVPIDKQTLRSCATVTACLLLAAAALPAVTSAGDTSVDVGNVDPEVIEVDLPSTDLSPTAGSTTSTDVHVSVEDLNGCSDINRVSVAVNQNDNTTHIPATDLMQSGGWDSCSAGLAHFNYTFQMQYYDPPAVGSDTYEIYVEVEDDAGASSNNLLDLGGMLSFNYAKLAALDTSPNAIDFGTDLDPGQTSSTQTTGVENQGNVQIDLQLSGTNLTHGTENAELPVSNVDYSKEADMSNKTALGTTASHLAYGLAAGASSTDDLYWTLTVPTADEHGWVPSGSYQGDVTITASEAT